MKSITLSLLMLVALIFYGQKINDNRIASNQAAAEPTDSDYKVILKSGKVKYYHGYEKWTETTAIFRRDDARGLCHYDTIRASDVSNIIILKPQWEKSQTKN